MLNNGRYEEELKSFTLFHKSLINIGEHELAASAQSRINKCKRLMALKELNGYEFRDLSNGRYAFF